MYLVLGSVVEQSGFRFTPQPFLIFLSEEAEDGSNAPLTQVCPKHSREKIPVPGEKESRTVLKV